MDADNRLIPLVEDDQGEGIKDFVEETVDLEKRFRENYAKAKETLTKGKTENEMLEQINGKLDRLLEVFGDHRLIDGKFVDISKALPYSSISMR